MCTAHKMQTKNKKLLAVITSTPNFGFTGALNLLCHVRNYTQDCNEKFNTAVCSIMALMLLYVIVDVAVPSYLVASKLKCYCAQYDPSFAKLATEYCVSLDICHQPFSSVIVKKVGRRVNAAIPTKCALNRRKGSSELCHMQIGCMKSDTSRKDTDI